MSASPLPEPLPAPLVRQGSRLIRQLAYGALFVIALPILLGSWAFSLDRQLHLPMVGAPLLGTGIALIGALVIVAAIVALRLRGGGWPMSPYPPQRRVTTGVYALVAHPLYLGSIFLTFGLSMRFANAAGIWIVTPVLAASCIAFVWGSEEERTRELFGPSTTQPLIHLPASSDDRPRFSDRLSACFLALLPWLVVYEAINLLETPPDAVDVASAWDARIPVSGWTELVYFLTYPLVLFAPLVARKARDLREVTIRAWIATAGSAICYLALPTVFEKKPVPASPFALLLEWERAFDAPNTALPSFHVIWTMLVLPLYVRAFPRLRVLQWPIVLAIAASCVTTGMHAIADVLAGLAAGLVFMHIEAVWRWLARGAEIVSASWAEWRGGPVRLINHGLYGALGVALGMALILALAGAAHRNAIVFIAASVIAGAAIWAQSVEGSAALLRPFGYYGGILGGGIAIAIASLWSDSGFLLLAAYAVAAPFIQAAGRFRCLVQGCCHGRPTTNAIGIRVTHPKSRVVRIANLSGVPLHPTALYSIVTNVFIGILLLRLWIAGASLTFIAGAFFILSGLARFVEEHYRGEPQTRVIGGLRLYQWMSMASLIAGAALTAVPSPAAPPMQGLSIPSIAAALIAGCAAYFAYGADFPQSNRRFARLT